MTSIAAFGLGRIAQAHAKAIIDGRPPVTPTQLPTPALRRGRGHRSDLGHTKPRKCPRHGGTGGVEHALPRGAHPAGLSTRYVQPYIDQPGVFHRRDRIRPTRCSRSGHRDGRGRRAKHCESRSRLGAPARLADEWRWGRSHRCDENGPGAPADAQCVGVRGRTQ
jgi:hypothetical protein